MAEPAVSISELDQVRALTQALFDCAHSGDWEGVVALEAERRTLLYALFDGAPRPVEGPARTLISDILKMDQEVMSLTQQRRGDLSDWLRQVGHGRSALKAYDSNTR